MLFLSSFPYVCPEPVLVNCSSLCKNGPLKGVFRTTSSEIFLTAAMGGGAAGGCGEAAAGSSPIDIAIAAAICSSSVIAAKGVSPACLVASSTAAVPLAAAASSSEITRSLHPHTHTARGQKLPVIDLECSDSCFSPFSPRNRADVFSSNQTWRDKTREKTGQDKTREKTGQDKTRRDKTKQI